MSTEACVLVPPFAGRITSRPGSIYPSAPRKHRAGSRNRILIIGAGLSGAYLAQRLLQQAPALDLRVIEEGEEPGGRMLSRRLPDDTGTLDFGAARFNRQQHPRLTRLVQALRLPVAPFPHDGGCLHLREPHRGRIPDLLHKALAGSDRSAWRTTPFLTQCSQRLTPEEIDTLIAAQGYDVLLDPRLPVSEVVRILNDHPESCDSEAEWLRIVPGFQEIVKQLCRDVARMGGSSRFRTRVHAIERLPSGRLRVWCEDGSCEEADRVILTTPRLALEKIDLPIDADRRRAIRSVEAIPLMKAFFLFPRSWWNAAGFEDGAHLITDTPLRKVYFRPRQIMVYNDSASARYWEPLCDERAIASGLLWRVISRSLRDAMRIPKGTEIPAPSHHFAKFWQAGVHFWALGARPAQVQQELLAPDDILHICSEAYSPISGWGEAALASAELLLEQLTLRMPGLAQPSAAL